MKIFVGTMYSGENEFAECVQAISNQKGVQITHHFVIHKREIEACIDLYGKWNEVKTGYDAFIQVDADTVVTDPNLFAQAVVLLKSEMAKGTVTAIQYKLHDFFTNGKINGLNVYSPAVVFETPHDEVYCERITKNHVIHAPINDIGGQHSPNPTMRQSFHFGLHRGLKNRNEEQKAVKHAFLTYADDRRAMAYAGYVASKDFPRNKHCYADSEFEDVYIETCKNFAAFKTKNFKK